jgi:carbonic anhydrase
MADSSGERAMAKGKVADRLVDLTTRFDGAIKNPDRFREDPNRAGHPDPSFHAPHRPIKDTGIIADLIRRGNLNYAGFIQGCRSAVGKKPRRVKDVKSFAAHYLFLNEEEVALGDEGVKTQDPYAAILSCIDSRVPVEMVTGQGSNDVFVVRSAGNILTSLGEATGSMHYILDSYAVGSPNPQGHKTLSAILVLGHTRCGAVAAAYDAFRPGGSGTVGMPPSLAAILYEIKWSVDFVLANCKIAEEEKIKDAISMVNAVHSHIKVGQMAKETGTASGLEVFYGTYDVTDFYLHRTNIPGYPDQRFPQAMAARGADRFDSWLKEGPEIDAAARAALAEDAAEFAERATRQTHGDRR